MIELLLVLVLIAMISGMAALALRDGMDTRIERETLRLAALLEAGRAESRASGVAVRFELLPPDAPAEADGLPAQFRFVGLEAGTLPGSSRSQPGRWLEPTVAARVDGGGSALLLGPEPLIGAQRITLRLGNEQRVLATDGLAPFQPLSGASAAAP